MELIVRLCNRAALDKATRVTMDQKSRPSALVSSCLTRLLYSAAGLFFLCTLSNSAFGQCCSVPSQEVSSVYANTGPLVFFAGTISDPSGHSWDGLYVYEVDPENTSPDSDTCWWPDNPLNLPQTPSIALNTQQNGGLNYWEVDSDNQYGVDAVGIYSGYLSNIVNLHPSTVQMPCTITIAQEMEVECSDSLVWQYVENILTMSANSQYTYKSCRNNQSTGAVVCGCGKVTSTGTPAGQIACSSF